MLVNMLVILGILMCVICDMVIGLINSFVKFIIVRFNIISGREE